MPQSKKTSRLTIRLPPEVRQALDVHAAALRRTASSLALEYIDLGLSRALRRKITES